MTLLKNSAQNMKVRTKKKYAVGFQKILVAKIENYFLLLSETSRNAKKMGVVRKISDFKAQ